MAPKRETQVERIVKRVTNAIHNPTSTLHTLRDALNACKDSRVTLYQEEYDEWTLQAIKMGRHDMILTLFGEPISSSLEFQRRTVLKFFIFKKSRYLKAYVKSSAFNPESIYVLTMLERSTAAHIPRMEYFFSLPKTGDLLLSLRSNYSPRYYKYLVKHNPDIQKKMNQRKLLTRFWLLHVKKLLPLWKESLYVPVTGAMYKKALASFEGDMRLIHSTPVAM